MNKTKRAILIVVIILNLINAGLNIFFIVDLFLHYALNDFAILMLVYYFASIAGFLTASGLLIYAIAGGGRYFTTRHSYYMAAIVISVFMSLFSASSVLLIITLFMSDIVWVKPVDDPYFTPQEDEKSEEDDEKARAKKIERLRALRDSGQITEEEFKDELMKLL